MKHTARCPGSRLRPPHLRPSDTLGHVARSPGGSVTPTGAAPITSYEVFRGASSDPQRNAQIGTATAHPMMTPRSPSARRYYYSVKAVNIVGDSSSSNVVSVLVKGIAGVTTLSPTQILRPPVVH